MRRTDPAILAARPPSLQYDLFHSHIIPDILSEHLHLSLVAPAAPTWNAFYTLPLVSLEFRHIVRSHCVMIFGLTKDEDHSVIANILSFVRSLWRQAKRGPQLSRPVLEYTGPQLMEGSSLIRIYMCIALGRSFLNHDVLRYIVPAGRDWEFAAHEQRFIGEDMICNERTRMGSRMPDQTMHRLFLPLTCAMKLCDSILPERLAFIVAEYLADIVPLLATAPVMLKYSQDLRSYIDRDHKIEGEIWVKWIHQTLGLIENAELLIKEMQGTGRLVESFPRRSCVPREIIKVTNIDQVLRDVLITDWGRFSKDIQMRARSILRGWNLPETSE